MEYIMYILILVESMQWDGKAELTAYTPSIEETWGDPYTMASGIKVFDGAIACPSNYKFGTIIHFENMGVFQCWDRGGAIKNDRFDVFMWDKKQAIEFGRKKNISYRVINLSL